MGSPHEWIGQAEHLTVFEEFHWKATVKPTLMEPQEKSASQHELRFMALSTSCLTVSLKGVYTVLWTVNIPNQTLPLWGHGASTVKNSSHTVGDGVQQSLCQDLNQVLWHPPLLCDHSLNHHTRTSTTALSCWNEKLNHLWSHYKTGLYI